jgi:addiction module HigA family antidote
VPVTAYGITAYRLSKDTGISNMAISEIVRGKRSITPRVAIRFSKYFGVSEGCFSRLQLQYDIDLIKEKVGGEVDKIHRKSSLMASIIKQEVL